ncbi:ABC transporter substrate-binding protein [Flavobacterium aquicola]|uniref:ABC-type Fe3+-hydroxamate transport system substrate-binding protein n=1 Tax=Flavobacterium aquicola TaxID=1682742 RepID=A0A3E0EX40_9FLAO|nr:helical backbone metal receptor [Flavobacterium aquicola]REH02020.1 ABC-type Fe3+-hydroxamate transport system substrate-binding protein [Flavobacterium aquicola]
MKQLKDQVGFSHSFEITPKRIVSLVPSQTELLYDLGLEENIVGITKFCVHPYHLKSTKKTVGGTKKVNYDKIRELNPDIIICNKEENTQEIVEELKKICSVWVTDIFTIEDNFQMITDFGQIFNRRTEARKWNDKLTFALSGFKEFVKDIPVKKVAYFIWKNPYMVAGSGTFIDELLKLNHFQNQYASRERYPEIDLEKMDPDGSLDLALLSSEPFPFKAEDGYDIVKFTNSAQAILVDGEMFSWYGSRLLKAFDYFKYLHNSI